MMSVDLARAFDPAILAQDCCITPDPWQRDFLRGRHRRALLNCCRQSGKTTISALVAIDEVLQSPSALVIVVSPSQRQSGEFFRTALQYYKRLDGVPDISAELALRAEFGNDARLIALPGSETTVRGYAAANLIIVDEAARVPDELLTAVRPMLATSNGRLIGLSTPAGRRGWFFEAWHSGDPAWHRVSVPASACPRISAEFLAEELRELGPQKFSEEYELVFRDSDEAVFGTEMIAAAFTDDVVPLWG